LRVVTQGGACGDGVVGATEQCDDGNVADFDGCSATCQVESGSTCYPSGICGPNFCGDGIVGNGEICDDGNSVGGDGCDALCQFEDTSCANPGLITSTVADPSFRVAGSTAGNANDFALGCLATTSQSGDVVYEF